MSWSSLIFGSYSHAEIADAVADTTWQRIRTSMLHRPEEEKYTILLAYVNAQGISATEQHQREVRVTNYVNALKRGGLIK